MLSIIPTTPPQLSGRKPFGFKTNNHFNERRNFPNLNPGEKLEQDLSIGRIKAYLEHLSSFPCEASLTISVQNGSSSLQGEFRPYEGRAQHATEFVKLQIEDIVSEFTAEHKQSSFTINFTQTVEITKIHR